MDQPLLSICIPTWNRWYSIDKVVLSLTKQIETQNISADIVVSDNCSTDNTNFLLKEIEKQYKMVKYYKNSENIWWMKNISKVMTLWNWEYLWWLWSDDLVINWWLKETQHIIMKYHPDIIMHTYLHNNKINLLKNKYYHEDENIFIFNSQKEYLNFLWDQYNYDKSSYDWFLEYLLSVFSVWIVKKQYYIKAREKIINEKWNKFFDEFNFIHILCNTFNEVSNPIILVCNNYLDWGMLKEQNIELDKKVRWTPTFSISKDSCYVYNYLIKEYNLWKNFKKLRNKNNFYWTLSAVACLPWIRYFKIFIAKIGLLDIITKFVRRF